MQHMQELWCLRYLQQMEKKKYQFHRGDMNSNRASLIELVNLEQHILYLLINWDIGHLFLPARGKMVFLELILLTVTKKIIYACLSYIAHYGN